MYTAEKDVITSKIERTPQNYQFFERVCSVYRSLPNVHVGYRSLRLSTAFKRSFLVTEFWVSMYAMWWSQWPRGLNVGSHCNVTAYRNAVALQVTDELQAELSSRASRPNSIPRASHMGSRFAMGAPATSLQLAADGGDASRRPSTLAQAVTVSSL